MPSPDVVGRADEHERLLTRLSSGPGLVTLVGPGGVGKTTLALKVRGAAARPEVGLSSALFVDVSEASTGDGVVGRLGAALSLSVEGARTLEDAASRIGAALAARGPCLVVIDNAEQVLAAVAELAAAWLENAPELRLLVTSRERLGIAAEEVMPLEVLSREAAVELFLERARGARPGFAVRESELARLHDVVDELDRLPLALELAAARLEVLSLEQLAERLQQKLELLKRVGVQGPDRHRALSATIAWSWDLLDDDERGALAQASVFRGGFSLDAAEEVVVVSGSVLDSLQALKRKSLVMLHAGPRPRFALLETVRAFAAERLTELGSRAAVEERHARYFAARTRGPLDGAALDDEAANLVAALRYARVSSARDAAEIALFVARLLAPRAPVPLRLTYLDQAVDDAEKAQDGELSGRAHLDRGELRRARGEHREAEEDLRAAGAALETGGADSRLLAAVWSARGALYGQRGDLAAADDALTKAIELSEHAPEVRAVAFMRRFALRIVEERLEEAERAGSEALALLERTGDRRNEGVTLGNLAALRLELGRLDEACLSAEKAREVQRSYGDPLSECMSLLTAALAHVESGRAARGRECAAEALHIAERESDRRIAGFAHAALGLALEAEGALADAIEELSCAERLSADDDAIAARFHPRCYRAVLVARGGDVGKSEALLASVERDSGPPGARVAKALLRAAHALLAAQSDEERAAAEQKAVVLLDDTRDSRGVHPRLARRWLERELAERRDRAPPRVLEVGPEARFATTTTGQRVDLSRRGPTRRLLLCLVDARAQRPGSGVSVDELIDAGWPEEKMTHDSAVDRVYAAVRQLRLLGFDACLLTHDDGYLIDPEVTVRRVER